MLLILIRDQMCEAFVRVFDVYILDGLVDGLAMSVPFWKENALCERW